MPVSINFSTIRDAQADDVHGAARDEVLHIPHELRGTGRVDAIPGHFIFGMFYRLSAGRTNYGGLYFFSLPVRASTTGPIT